MSTYSENNSMISLGDKEMSIEDSMDFVIKQIQEHLNSSQYRIRQLSQCAERDEPFTEEVKLSDNLQDDLLEIQRLFMDLLDISDQLISIPVDKNDIDFYKNHKKERKLHIKQKLKQYELDKKTEKENRKTNKMGDITE